MHHHELAESDWRVVYRSHVQVILAQVLSAGNAVVHARACVILCAYQTERLLCGIRCGRFRGTVRQRSVSVRTGSSNAQHESLRHRGNSDRFRVMHARSFRDIQKSSCTARLKRQLRRNPKPTPGSGVRRHNMLGVSVRWLLC
jgi:hypothetical protein